MLKWYFVNLYNKLTFYYFTQTYSAAKFMVYKLC